MKNNWREALGQSGGAAIFSPRQLKGIKELACTIVMGTMKERSKDNWPGQLSQQLASCNLCFKVRIKAIYVL